MSKGLRMSLFAAAAVATLIGSFAVEQISASVKRDAAVQAGQSSDADQLAIFGRQRRARRNQVRRV